jgi:hypothetical protein
MQFSLAFVFATLALASAQKDAQRKTVKEQMMEHRKDMFVDNQVSKTKAKWMDSSCCFYQAN